MPPDDRVERRFQREHRRLERRARNAEHPSAVRQRLAVRREATLQRRLEREAARRAGVDDGSRGDRTALWTRVAIVVGLVAIAVASFFVTRPEDVEERPADETAAARSERYVAAVVAALQDEPGVELDAAGAQCVAGALVTTLAPSLRPAELDDLTASDDPLAALPEDQRDAVLRTIVTCVDPATAVALLSGGSPSTTLPAAILPAEVPAATVPPPG